jgi:hypothetical protein
MEGPNQREVSAEPSTPPRYRGIAGWLLFFILSLTIITPAFQVYVVYNEWKLHDTAPSSLLFNVLASSVFDWRWACMTPEEVARMAVDNA